MKDIKKNLVNILALKYNNWNEKLNKVELSVKPINFEDG
jgi:hypothetical protein